MPTSANSSLINQAISELSLNDGSTNMFTFDVIPLDSSSATVMVATVNQTTGKNKLREVGVCSQFFTIKEEEINFLEKKQFNAQHLIDSYTNAVIYFSSYEKKEISIWEGNSGPQDVVDTKVLQFPKHGVLQEKKWYQGNPIFNPSAYEYKPDVGFAGNDSVIIAVTVNGWKVKLKYYLEVTDTPEPSSDKQCGKRGVYWKISQTTPDASTSDLAAWQRSTDLSSLIASANQVFQGFTNLAGSAVGTTVGQGPTAQITLDSDAAGHGWYIDPTPLDNTDDYLPTSDPNIWQAKAGTDAEGKMDMLSVLLHEYGHALGLDHSADSHDFMAETLQAGQRKLPTADELQLMANLVAQLKGDAPTDPTSPDKPSAPGLPSSLALAGLLAARRKDTSSALLSQKLVSVNPSLQNTGFAQGSTQGWSVDGVVSTGTDGASKEFKLSLAPFLHFFNQMRRRAP